MNTLLATLFPPGTLAVFGIPEWVGDVLVIIPKGQIGIQFSHEFFAEIKESSQKRKTRKKPFLAR